MKRKWWIAGLLIALAVTLISPLASAWPDGLERVAEDRGFSEDAQDAPYEVIPDYVLPGIGNEAVATILAGIVGTLVVFGLAYGLGALLRRREASGG
jgi:hypothetical protein